MKQFRFKKLVVKKYFKREGSFIKAYLSEIDKPNDIICVLPIYDRKEWVDIIQRYEAGQESPMQFLTYNDLLKPFPGSFVDVQSKWGPLYYKFTIDDYELGHCSKEMINKAQRDNKGDVVVYNSLKIFIPAKDFADIQKYEWNPEIRAQYYYYNYCYFRLSELKEPFNYMEYEVDEYEESEYDDPNNSYDEEDTWWALTDGMRGEFRKGVDWDRLSDVLGY